MPAAVAAWSRFARRLKSLMLATTQKPASADSIDVSRPKPLDAPVTITTFSGIRLVYHTGTKNWNRSPESATIYIALLPPGA